MKKLSLLLMLAAVGILASSGGALGYLINDDYIGAAPTSSSYYGKDVIGNPDWFGISTMVVDLSGGMMVVDIYSTYYDNIGQLSTELGDLFISTDGWNPRVPTKDDNYFNPGEKWEYVIALDDHLNTSGTAKLYALASGENYGSDIELSYAPNGYVYREGQEVQYEGPEDGYLEEGTWSVSGGGDFLRISMPMPEDWSSIPESKFGFHNTMTCANDVIEGAPSPVPEPATMLLLGTGLVGLAGFRKKFKK